MIELSLVPAGPGKHRALFGEMAITKPTRQPLFDSARALIRLGYSLETVITARHQGSETIAMSGVVGELAIWRIEESDRGGLKKRGWSPFETAASSVQGSPIPGADAVEGTSGTATLQMDVAA